MNRLYFALGMLYPRRYRESTGKLLLYSGSNINPAVWLGGILFLNLLSVTAIYTFWRIIGEGSTLIQLISYALTTFFIQSIAYIIPYYAAERRAKSVESVLPGFYQLVASYLRSGMTPFQALKSSSKKEFGVLKTEIDIATSKALGTQSFNDAFLGIANKIKSENLKRSTELLVRGMESGGSLARMLEESAANLIENKSLRRQIVTASRTYTLMVIFAVIIGSPLLLSISTRFNERLSELTENIGAGLSDVQGMDLGLLATSIDQTTLLNATIVSVIGTSLISSFLIGIIIEGKEKFGFKYALMFVPASLALFFIFRTALQLFF